MKILVIAATEAEIALSIKHIEAGAAQYKEGVFDYLGHHVSFCITGVGMVATAYKLTQRLCANNYDIVIQAGIAGSFDRNIPLGEVVFVSSDRFGDLGVENGVDFQDVFTVGLIDEQEEPFDNGLLINPVSRDKYHLKLREVDALTVNTVTGSEETVTQKMSLYNCTLETMEGAALHYVCLLEKQEFIQLRAISNYVEKRNRAVWEIDKAINNLNDYLVNIIEKLAL